MTDKLGLSETARNFLSRLRVAQSPEDLVGDGLPPELLTQMLDRGFLEPQGDTVSPTNYQDNYVNWPGQRMMLIDHTRTLAFQEAIAAQVAPGDRVVDVGAGSGILTMMAARAGAIEAIGLELTSMADWAELLAGENGLDAVRIVRGDAAEFTPDGPVDLVMGEFAGMYLIDEWRHYAAFCAVRDKTLRPGGKVLPRAARMYLSALDSPKLYRQHGYGFWETPVYGFDFSAVGQFEADQPRRYFVDIEPDCIIDTQEVASFDFLTGSERDFFFASEVVFHYPNGGNFHGLIGHFDMDMAPGQWLSTAPMAHQTHWQQTYFPMRAMQVPPGGSLHVQIRTWQDEASGQMALGLTVAPPNSLITPETPEFFVWME